MNFLFGLVPAVFLIIVVVVIHFFIPKVLTLKLAAMACCAIIVVGALLSFNTYGPRVETGKAVAPPYEPKPVDIKTGAEMIESKDRIGQFDDRVGEEP